MWTGESLVMVVPSPTSPESFDPQENNAPSSATAVDEKRPEPTAAIDDSPGTTTGSDELAVLPCPSIPAEPVPHTLTWPLDSKIIAFWPAEMARTLVTPGTVGCPPTKPAAAGARGARAVHPGRVRAGHRR